ncbi:MAG: RloB family protein [Rhodobacteraceae bacterium]|nr:RloB family protein [Paracoccaceae bacterium]
MGTGNRVHRRTAIGIKSLERQRASKQPYRKVLVVCEGEKTEPRYFTELSDRYRLNSARIEIYGCGSDPYRVFELAKQRYKDEKAKGDGFDKVFCVFDEDNHTSYQNALQEIQVAKPKDTFEAIHSVPCFEYWLLLHFVYTTKPYASLSGNSACQQVETDLKKYMPLYSKGNEGIFEQLAEKIDIAYDRAKKSLLAAKNAGTHNPTTRVHSLVEYLKHLKD